MEIYLVMVEYFKCTDECCPYILPEMFGLYVVLVPMHCSLHKKIVISMLCLYVCNKAPSYMILQSLYISSDSAAKAQDTST
jgi:hypothetical protein